MYLPAARPRVQTDAHAAPADTPPVRTTTTTSRVAGVTLVRVELRSDLAVEMRVRVSNELDGPVLPPRRAGVPSAGWDADGFSGTIPASGRLGIGYACPAVNDPDRSPAASADDPGESSDESPGVSSDNPDASVVSVDLLGPADADTDERDLVSSAVRTLGRATPPADAVPTETAAAPHPEHSHGEPDDDGGADAPLPDALDAWLDAVETRVEHAERLTDASVSEATAVLDACGGIDPVSELPDSLAADRRALRTVAARIDDLAARAAVADPDPVVSALAEAAEGSAVRETPTASPSTEDR